MGWEWSTTILLIGLVYQISPPGKDGGGHSFWRTTQGEQQPGLCSERDLHPVHTWGWTIPRKGREAPCHSPPRVTEPPPGQLGPPLNPLFISTTLSRTSPGTKLSPCRNPSISQASPPQSLSSSRRARPQGTPSR